MKKKILALLFGFVLTFSLVGCGEGETLNVNVENDSDLNSSTLGTQSFVNIGDDLFYDGATGIIYINNVTYGLGCHVYTPYYAPNGLPYKYNSQTNTFEEIDFDDE